MKENILERILRAESEFDQKLGHIDEQVEAHRASVGGRYGDGLRSLHQERLDVEQALDAEYARAYAEREQAMVSAIEHRKQALRASKEEKGEAIVKRLKAEIEGAFFA